MENRENPRDTAVIKMRNPPSQKTQPETTWEEEDIPHEPWDSVQERKGHQGKGRKDSSIWVSVIKESKGMQRRHLRRVFEFQKFRKLVDEWKIDTEFTSSISDLVMHPNYQRIIGMGPKAVPFILRELKRESRFWFWALTAITGVDPVPEHNQGVIEKMKEDWLEWGRVVGYI